MERLMVVLGAKKLKPQQRSCACSLDGDLSEKQSLRRAKSAVVPKLNNLAKVYQAKEQAQ